MTVWAYARVSTTEQAAEDRSSLDDQIRTCQAAATIAKLPAPVVILDPGVSGTVPLAKRPGGGEMVAALASGDVVIASKLDRLFRSASDALNNVESMKSAGVRLILVDIGTDPVTESAVSKMFLGIMASVAEFERSRILERMVDGRKGKKARGGHIGGLPPFGYRKIGTGKAATLEADPVEQDTIALIRRLRETGVSLRGISARLSAMGRTSREGTPLSTGLITKILKASG